MAKEVNKFILEGEEIEFTDSKAREDISTLDDKIDYEVGRLETEISGKATIDDSDITTNKTWSSGQIFAEDNATREITATLNLTNRAEQAYNVGEFLIYNSKLYKVIASISQGDLLTPGTNVKLSKVSTELKELDTTCGNLQSQINNKATIDDSDITTSKTWSSSQILSEDNSIRENIATLNLTNLAEQNYSVGDLIEWNHKLCKVIAPISQGDTLALGTNLNRTTVSDELDQAGGSEIDDLVISTTKTWSSSKIDDEFNKESTELITITLGDFSGQSYLRKRGHNCNLSLTIENFTNSGDFNTAIATIPNGYRPHHNVYFTVYFRSGSGYSNSDYEIGVVYIEATDGTVRLRGNNAKLINMHYCNFTLEWEV